jgi:O-methyltransferase involved in polyketide biosynthesis
MHHDPLVPFDTSTPNIARVYDYLLGGKDNFAADREMAAEVLGVYPLAAVLARENRGFLARAVEHVSRQGITQFLDLGAGLPTSPSTHEVAQRVNPGARVVYVDNDPVVISHIAALLAVDGVTAVPGDVRDPAQILAGLELDLTQPTCVILTMLLHFLDDGEAANIVAAFTGALAPGSFLIASVGINNDDVLADRVTTAYNASDLHDHGRTQIASYFAGLEIVEPGLTEARNWRPEHPQADEPAHPADVLAGVGRKS